LQVNPCGRLDLPEPNIKKKNELRDDMIEFSVQGICTSHISNKNKKEVE